MKFPRSNGAPAVVIAGNVWDDVADVLEWVQGLSVSAPLMMADMPGGPVISLRLAGAQFFPVKVEKTGGSNGTSSTPASYTYTVRRTDWTGSGTSADFELGTAVAQTRPRPNGPVTFQTGSVGYGVAFYDGSTLKLWDAGEVPTTVVGCT